MATCSVCGKEFTAATASFGSSTPVCTDCSTKSRAQGTSKGMLSRYTDAYRVARTVTGFGATVKAVAVIIGLLIGFTALLAGSQSLLYTVGGAILGIIVAVPIFILGVLVSAQGQILKATLDTAVNSSQLLTKDEMQQIMSLD